MNDKLLTIESRADELRRVLEIPEATDEEILELTKGSLTRASVEFNLALREFGRTLARSLPRLYGKAA